MTSLFTLLALPAGSGQWLQVLFDVAVKSLIILLAAKALVAGLKKSSAAARHLVWSLTVSALLVLPVTTLVLPGVRFPVLPTLLTDAAADAKHVNVMAPHAEVADAILSAPAVKPAGREETAASPKPAADVWAEAQALPPAHLTFGDPGFIEANTAPAGRQKSFDWALLLLAVWSAGLLAVTARFLLGFIKVWRIARGSKPVTEISWVTLANGLSNRLGLRRGVRVVKSERVTLPMTWGAFRSVVLLPEASGGWSLKCRTIVLMHELAHVKRRDCLTQTVAQLACALYWFNPMVWSAARRLRVERELACDDEVIRAGTRATDYAGYLVEIASSFGANVCVSPFAVGMACSELENRVRAILNPEVKRQANDRLKVALSAALAALFIVPLSVIQPWGKASASDEKSRPKPDAIQADSRRQEQALPEGAPASGREVLHSIDAIKVSLQANSAVSQPGETKIENPAGAPGLSRELVQPASFDEGQGAGQGVGEGKATGQGPGAGDGSGQGFGAGSGVGIGRGSGSGAGFGSGQESGQGEKRRDLTADEVGKLTMNNVTPEYLESVRRMGFDNATVNQIIQMRVYQVDEDFLRQVRGWGYDKATIRDLISLRVAGVTGAYVTAMKSAGFDQLTIGQLASMKQAGVTPEFIEAMRRAGYDKLGWSQLVSLRHQGISGEFIRQTESWVGSKLTLNQLMQIKIHDVTPAYANEVKAMGFDTVPFTKLIELRIHGLTSDYVREMRSLGFNNLTLDQLLRMRIHGVTSDYVKRLRAAGFVNVTVDQLIEMKMHGLDEILLKNSK